MTPKDLNHLVYRIFYFLLIWLVKLNTGCPLLHCTCSSFFFFFFFFLSGKNFVYFYFHLIREEINQIYTIGWWLVFEVYKMDFRTLLAQLFSNLRVKLWKVLIRGKTCCFFLFLALFIKMYHVCVCDIFLSPSGYLINSIFQCPTYL